MFKIKIIKSYKEYIFQSFKIIAYRIIQYYVKALYVDLYALRYFQKLNLQRVIFLEHFRTKKITFSTVSNILGNFFALKSSKKLQNVEKVIFSKYPKSFSSLGSPPRSRRQCFQMLKNIFFHTFEKSKK